MDFLRCRATVAVLVFSFAAWGAENPFARDRGGIQAGEAQYQALCSGCHGVDGGGTRAPNLHLSRLVLAEEAEPLFDAVKNGIPGTEMASMGLADTHVWQIVAYLRSESRPGAQVALEGDVEAGQRIFDAIGCRKCHMIEGHGGILGPDLSGIAATQRSETIRQAVLQPDKSITPGYQGVLVIDQSGRKYTGMIKNEDNFSIQLLTTTLRRVSLDRAGLRALDRKAGSFMPGNYKRRLSELELTNLLAFWDRRQQPVLSYEKGFGNY